MAVVGAAALWALLRPGRQHVVVPSVSLWQQAAESLGSQRRRSRRRIGAAWVLLLAGAVVAVLAMARPVWLTVAPMRRVALAIRPSAELIPSEVYEAAKGLLDRLDEDDQVRLVLPEMLGGVRDWQTCREAKEALSEVEILPVRAGLMRLPPIPADVQHTYYVAAAGAPGVQGPNVTAIGLSHESSGLHLDALGAEVLGEGKCQVYAAFHNPAGQARTEQIEIDIFHERAGRPRSERLVRSLTVGAHETAGLEWVCAAGAGLAVGQAGSNPESRGYLVRRERRIRRVALVGADAPLIRRFVRVDPMLEWVGREADADIVIANRGGGPKGTPALVICPEGPPAGWLAGKQQATLMLRDGSWDRDDPVMRNVDMSAVAVRKTVSWKVGPIQSGKALVSCNQEALVVRNDPDVAGGGVRHVFVAFDLDSENTNFCSTEAFVVFAANAMRWLSPGGRGQARYEYVTPEQAGPPTNWVLLSGTHARRRSTVLPWPSLYAEPGGRWQAVSLPGIRDAKAAADADTAVALAPLPEPEYARRGYEFWPLLAMAAVGCWLVGWALRSNIAGG